MSKVWNGPWHRVATLSISWMNKWTQPSLSILAAASCADHITCWKVTTTDSCLWCHADPCPVFTYSVGLWSCLPNSFPTLIPFKGPLLWVKNPNAMSSIQWITICNESDFQDFLLSTDSIGKHSQTTLWVEYSLELRSLWTLLRTSGRRLSPWWHCLNSSRKGLMPTWKAYTGTFVKCTSLYLKL